MSRRQQRRASKTRRHLQPTPGPTRPIAPESMAPRVVVREAAYVERLAYTRGHAAQALGISRSTLRRLLPYMETIEMPWGATLIPVDELERIAAERRRPTPTSRHVAAPVGGSRASGPSSSSVSAPSDWRVEASARSRTASTPTESRQHTGASGGGRRRCAPSSGGQPEPSERGRGAAEVALPRNGFRPANALRDRSRNSHELAVPLEVVTASRNPQAVPAVRPGRGRTHQGDLQPFEAARCAPDRRSERVKA